MSTYFINFPEVPYKFGANLPAVAYQNLTAYVDVIDQIKDNIAFYRNYYIQEGDRPDQLSFELYGTTDYYWMFYLLNDHIKEQGWPLTYDALSTLIDKDLIHTVVETKDVFANKMKVGQTVTGSSSGVSGTIAHRNLDLGQLYIKDLQGSTFGSTEVLTSQVGETVESITLISSAAEKNAVRYYVDGDNTHSDIDPHADRPNTKTPVTHLDYYLAENEKLKSIRVIRPDAVRDIFREFQDKFLDG
tara:strand:- start:3085 stop:3819 length:735 start_codon:yes stop_codon:yes gene_type:complete